jgi:cell division protein FtsB
MTDPDMSRLKYDAVAFIQMPYTSYQKLLKDIEELQKENAKLKGKIEKIENERYDDLFELGVFDDGIGR